MLSQDPEQVMPPPTGKPLTRKQIDLFERWIEQGAPWKEHWAFEPIAAPPVPNQGLAVGDVFNPIDAFVLEKCPRPRTNKVPWNRGSVFCEEFRWT